VRVRRKLLLVGLAATLAAAGLMVPTLQPAYAASLTEVTNFGDNPGRMRMHIYVPDNRPARPATVVAMHGCGGSGPGFYRPRPNRRASATASTSGPTPPSAVVAAATRSRSSR
jgi:poly(3-hydroxybutyrate) depolymerase